ncbi:MAG: 16S rRNA (cytosine(1402)-N(4))-methyltransferase RsmH [Dehalococcoidia bacterium]
MERNHTSVLLRETVEALNVQPGGRYIDCTVGGGGHAEAIMKASSPGGQLLGLDADPRAIEAASSKLKEFGRTVLLVNENFNNLGEICSRYEFYPVHGILFDLGLSSLQIEESGRGFSFQKEAPLDMRFSPDQKMSAAEVVNEFSEKDLAMLIWTYGEEPKSRKIARSIVNNRPLKTTTELARVISGAVNGERKRIHPATRTFQALRIAVNSEIENLRSALNQAIDVLGTGGVMAVISFHSLEDRAVKEFFSRESKQCICPPETPVCTCGHKPRLRIKRRKVIKPTTEEVKSNPRSRSARLRSAERIESV